MKYTTKNARSALSYAATLVLLLLPLSASAGSLNPVLQNPIAACVDGKPQVTISWSRIPKATSYTLFRLQKPQTKWITRYSHTENISKVDKNVATSTTYQYQVKAYFASNTVAYSNIVSVTTPKCTTTPTLPPIPTPPVLGSGEVIFDAYLTGYGWPDNTPASASISDGVIHSLAGGNGTFTDPITIAVGHSILNGKDILDYPKGTKFYIPALRRYFIVEDTCGDGNMPQNGPCHTGYQGHVWLDVWVGGQNQNTSSVLACEDKITDVHKVIKNPTSNYLVVPGPIFNSTCTSLFSETVVKI